MGKNAADRAGNPTIKKGKKNNMKKLVAFLLTLCMVLAIVPLAALADEGTPLVVAYSPFSAKFSPYYADTAYDQDVVQMTQISLMTTDRSGGIIYNAIEGEVVPYNGTDYLYTGPADIKVEYDEATDTTKYTAKLREDLVFSDGVPVTADDVIFTYYTYLDPSYVGSTTLSSYNSVGLKNYQTQTTDEVNAKYTAIAEAIYAAGNQGYVENDQYSEDLYNAYWETMKQVWTDDNMEIVNYVANAYGSDDYVQAYFNPAYTWAQISENEGLKIAFGMAMWGFGKFAEDGTFTNGLSSWDLVETFPEAEDYYQATYAAYEGDAEAYWTTEQYSGDGTDVLETTNAKFILTYGSQDESMGGAGVPNIAGIKKLDDYTVEVTTIGWQAPAGYASLGGQSTPLHYHCDVDDLDY